MNNKGFTFIEVLIVLAILGILAAVLIPSFMGQKYYYSQYKYVYDSNANVCFVERNFQSYETRPTPIPCTPAIIKSAENGE